MHTQTALVLGGTGLIGTILVKLLLEDESFEKVKVLVRNQFDMQHQKLIVEKVDFDNANDLLERRANAREQGNATFIHGRSLPARVRNRNRIRC